MIKFGDLVRIKEGFYEGCRGIVEDFESYQGTNIQDSYICYKVEIFKIDATYHVRGKIITVSENNVEIVK